MELFAQQLVLAISTRRDFLRMDLFLSIPYVSYVKSHNLTQNHERFGRLSVSLRTAVDATSQAAFCCRQYTTNMPLLVSARIVPFAFVRNCASLHHLLSQSLWQWIIIAAFIIIERKRSPSTDGGCQQKQAKGFLRDAFAVARRHWNWRGHKLLGVSKVPDVAIAQALCWTRARPTYYILIWRLVDITSNHHNEQQRQFSIFSCFIITITQNRVKRVHIAFLQGLVCFPHRQ